MMLQPLERQPASGATARCLLPDAYRRRIWPAFGALLSLLLFTGMGLSSAAAADATAELQKRVQQLEQQIGDLQVVIGTLESLAKPGGGGGSGASSTYGGGGDTFGSGRSGSGIEDDQRLSIIETQIRALSAQMEQLSSQLRGGSRDGRRGSNTQAPSDAGAAAASSSYAARGTVYEAGRTEQAPAFSGGFGEMTVTPAGGGEPSPDDPFGGYLFSGAAPGGRDDIGQDLGQNQVVSERLGQGWNSGAQRVARAPLTTTDPKSAYETAYGYFLQQDYTSAENAFSDFVKNHADNKLASNAQYWLGETYFVRGQYKSAAQAFLKGYETYGKGAKGADSLLRLAMSLAKLGQKAPACASLSELNTRYPNASAGVKRQAQSEMRRQGC